MTTIVNQYPKGKAPADVLPFQMDFSALIAKGETVTGQTVSCSPSGLTLSTPVLVNNLVNEPKVVLTYVSGGVLGTVYHLHFIVTTQTETIDRVGLLPVQEL